MVLVTSAIAASKSARDANLLSALFSSFDSLPSTSAPSDRRTSSSLSFALSRAACADAAPVKSRRVAASATFCSARLTSSFSSSIVGKSARFLTSASNLSWRGAHSENAFLATASFTNTWISAILDSNTERVRGRLASSDSLRGTL